MTPASEFRRRARETLDGQIFSSSWLYALIVSLIGSAIIGVGSTLVALAIIVTGPVSVGLCKYYIERTRRNINFDNLGVAFDAARQDAAGNIITGLLITLYTALWSLLLVVPGIIKAYSYSMAYYIKCDNPTFTATQAIDESRRIMDGNKWRLFCLHLSFLGWIIVGALCCGIGVLWVNAYMKAAEAEFYQEIKGDYVVVN